MPQLAPGPLPAMLGIDAVVFLTFSHNSSRLILLKKHTLCEMLKRSNIVAALRKKQDAVLQQDNCGIHGTPENRAWFKAEGVQLLEEWPSHSPDLNLIENF